MGFLGKQGSATGDIDTSSFNPNISVKPEYTQTTAGGTQITDPKVRDIRQQELSRFVKDVKDDFTSQDRTLQQGTKIAGDRLQALKLNQDNLNYPKKVNHIVNIVLELNLNKTQLRGNLTDALVKQNRECKKIKSWNRRYEEEDNSRTKNRTLLRR